MFLNEVSWLWKCIYIIAILDDLLTYLVRVTKFLAWLALPLASDAFHRVITLFDMSELASRCFWKKDMSKM
jgi:hypothetical protein